RAQRPGRAAAAVREPAPVRRGRRRGGPALRRGVRAGAGAGDAADRRDRHRDRPPREGSPRPAVDPRGRAVPRAQVMSRRAWWAFGFMSVVWGASYLLIKVAINGGLPPADIAWLRVALAAVVLVLPGAWGRGPGVMSALRGRWRWIVAYAVAEVSIPFPLIAAGEVHVASSLTAIIIAAVPLIVTVLSLRFDPSERPTPIRAVGLAVGFTGVVARVGLDVAGGGAELLGAAAILVGAVGYAVGPMLVKLGMGGLDSRAVMGASLMVAAVLLAPFAAAALP